MSNSARPKENKLIRQSIDRFSYHLLSFRRLWHGISLSASLGISWLACELPRVCAGDWSQIALVQPQTTQTSSKPKKKFSDLRIASPRANDLEYAARPTPTVANGKAGNGSDDTVSSNSNMPDSEMPNSNPNPNSPTDNSSSDSTSTPPPTVAAEFPVAVQLPDAANATSEFQTLCEFTSLKENEKVTALELATGVADLPKGMQFELRPANNTGEYFVYWMSSSQAEATSDEKSEDDESTKDSDDEKSSDAKSGEEKSGEEKSGSNGKVEPKLDMQSHIAEFQITDALKFRWNLQNETDVVLRDQLCNSLLTLKTNGEDRSLALRTEIKIPAIVLDFSEGNYTYALGKAPPKLDYLQVKIDAIEGIDASIRTELEPALGIGTAKDEAKIKFLDWKGLEFSVEPFRKPEGNMARVAFWYYLDDKRNPFSTEKVNQAIKQTAGGIESGNQRLVECQNAIRNIPIEIRRVEGTQVPSGPAGNAAQTAKQQALNNLNRQLRSAQQSAVRTAQQIPRLEQQLKDLTDLGTLGQKLHKIGKLKITVFAQNGNHSPIRVMSAGS